MFEEDKVIGFRGLRGGMLGNKAGLEEVTPPCCSGFTSAWTQEDKGPADDQSLDEGQYIVCFFKQD